MRDSDHRRELSNKKQGRPVPRSNTETTVNRLLKIGTAVCIAGIGYLVYREFLGYEGRGERIVLGVVLGILALLMLVALRTARRSKDQCLARYRRIGDRTLHGGDNPALVHDDHSRGYLGGIGEESGDSLRPTYPDRGGSGSRGNRGGCRPWHLALVRAQVVWDGYLSPTLTLDGHEFLPLGSISNRVTVHCNELGEYTIYKSDDHGFNNPKDQWALKPIDVALLGDSFTLGACVPTEKSFAALIGEAYPATLNLASGGNGPLIELATLREYLEDVRPRIVVWVYYEGNDLDNLHVEWKSHLLRSYLNRGFRQGLAARQHDIDSELLAVVQQARETSIETSIWTERLGQAKDAVKLMNLRALAASALRLQGKNTTDSQQEIDHLRTVLSEAETSVRSWGGSLYFVYLPTWNRYAHPKLAPSERDAVLATVKDLGIHVIDIHQAFAREPDPLAFFPFRQAGHYNEEGNRLVADVIINEIGRKQSKSPADRHARFTYPVQH